MSCEAVVLTTDGPPMNEIVTPERGVVVPVHHTEPRHLGVKFHVESVALENSIEQLMAMSDSNKEKLGQTARAWFLDNDAAFEARFASTVNELAGPGALPQNSLLP
jgi:hypothetical protein